MLIFLLTLLLIIVRLTIVVIALSVLLSFTVAWYERANSRPDLIEGRFTLRGVGIAIWLLVQETACLILTVLLRPFGWTQPKLPDSADGGHPPVILLHGLFQNRSCLFWMQYQLRSAGYRQVISINTPAWRDLETLTEELSRKVDEIKIRLKVDKVLLVGHSMGGMIARNYVQNRGGAAYVDGMVTLGSPHHGSKLAPFAVSSMGKKAAAGISFSESIQCRTLAVTDRSHSNLYPLRQHRPASRIRKNERRRACRAGWHGPYLAAISSHRPESSRRCAEQDHRMRTLQIKSRKQVEMIDITADVVKIVHQQGIRNGLVVISTPHTTAAVTINENADPDVCHDMINGIDKLVPLAANYRHREGNSAAHIKSSLYGASETVIIDDGAVVLGTWQGIYFCEFDGPRQRKVHIQVTGQ